MKAAIYKGRRANSELTMKITLILLCALLLAACIEDPETGEMSLEPFDPVWTTTSERIVIVRSHSHEIEGARLTVYDHSRDTLTSEAKNALYNLSTTKQNLQCQEDGSTFEITITDGTGEDSIYLSSNRACNDSAGPFIDAGNLLELIKLLK